MSSNKKRKCLIPLRKITYSTPGEYDYKIIEHIFTKNNWVHRINEVITILDDSSYNLNQISLDLTPPKTLPIYKNEYIEYKNYTQRLLPLGILQKETLVNLNISLEGKTCPTILSSEHNDFLKRSLFDFFINDVCDFEPEADLLDMVRDLIFNSIDNKPHESPNFRINTERVINHPDIQSASEKCKFNINGFLEILDLLIENFILFAVINQEMAGKRFVIKYSFELPVNQEDSTKEDLMFPTFHYKKPRIWRDASHHLTLCCPSELEISVEGKHGLPEPSRSSTPTKIKFILPDARKESDGLTFYVFDFSATLTPIFQGTRKWAVYSSLFILIFGLVSFLVRYLDISPGFSPPNSSVSILIASFSLIIAILAARKEHIYVAQSLGRYRKILSWTAFTIFLIAVLSSIPLNSKIPAIEANLTNWELIWIIIYSLIFYIVIELISVELELEEVKSSRI